MRLIFKGWEYNAGTEQDPNWVRVDTVDYSGDELEQPGKDGTYITVSEDIDLYPIFIEARWVDFNVGPTGNGANYVGSRFLLAWEDGGENAGMTDIEGQSVFTELEAPVRRGYTFGGWYAGVTDYDAETGEFSTGDCITETAVPGAKVAVRSGMTITGTEGSAKAWEVADGKLKFYTGLSRLTLYAKWIPDVSKISIVYWTENAEDDHFFSRAVKTVTTAELNEQLGTSLASGSVITLEQLQRFQHDHMSVLDPAYLDDVGAVQAGEQIFYDLKTARVDVNDKLFDASKVISGEGTTLFNVYYSRKVFTLVFHIGRDGYISTSGEQTGPNNGSWMQMFYNDSVAKSYDTAEGGVPNGSRGGSKLSSVTMSFNGTDYSSDYPTTAANVKNDYVPAAEENVYTITAKFGAYIGDRWPTPTNPAFSFTVSEEGSKKEMYTWSAYYGSRFTQLANDRQGSGQNWHPDINGVYSYMSAELCANRDGTAIINENQVHHLVAYFGDYNKAGVRKTYHILYEAIDGTYDASDPSIQLVPGSDFATYNLTTWTTNVAHANQSLLNGRSFYQTSEYTAISNLSPESQLASDLTGYELIYSCYNTPSTNNHHIYFFYRPREYTITFKYENQEDRKVDTYFYTQSLAGAKKYADPERTGYKFLGWYTNEAGAGETFDFAGSTMSAMNLVLYPVMGVLQYMVKIDPNGGVIDHINYDRPDEDYYGLSANSYGLSGSGHNRSQATYFTTNYGTRISPYTVERGYVQLSENELDPTHPNYYNGEKYYYVNAQFNAETDGDWGLPPDIRNAVYLTEEGLHDYFDYCAAVVAANLGYYTNVTQLNWDQFIQAYTSYPTTAYRPVSSEHYTFMGWYQVYDDGTEASMPYNFNDPVYGEITLRAKWRLDGGIYVKYNPYFFVEEGNTIIAVIGEISEWTDPSDHTRQLYADQSPTHILRAPTHITATDAQEWIFRGWRVVKPEGAGSTFISNGRTYTYQRWTPIQLDANGQPIYYDPGEEFTIESNLISQTDEFGSVIHMQAYYERSGESYRHPDVTNLILDANDDYGGYVNITDSTQLPALTGPGRQSIDTDHNLFNGHPTQIVIGDLQSNLALHLYRYATDKRINDVTGTKLFSNADQYLLIGFDENSDPNSPTTGKPFIPAFAADAVAAVTRNDNRILYAMWEPMVYVTFVNTTGADLVIDISGTGVSTVSIVNQFTGEFDRKQVTTQITVPAKSGDENGTVKVVLPGAVPGTDSFTATAINQHVNYKLNVSGEFPSGTPYGTGSADIRTGGASTYTGVLKTDATGIIVTYREEKDPAVAYDLKGGVWTDPSSDYKTTDSQVYSLFKSAIDRREGNSYEPADPTYSGKCFLGWTSNADIAAHTDFNSTSSVTWGETTITPDAGKSVLDKLRDNRSLYFWDFTQTPPYGETLYAVWADEVMVTFNVSKTNTALHTWTEPTTDIPGYYVFYRSGSTSAEITYTLLKGEKVPKPEDPTTTDAWAFLGWVTDSTYKNKTTNLEVINSYLFNFDEPVTENKTLYTSWISEQSIRKYTFTVKNEVAPDTEDEEFEYTISAASNMNYSGTYYYSDPTFCPVTTRLKHNETYTMEFTAIRYDYKKWEHNSLYLEVFDRNGTLVCSGNLLNYVRDGTAHYESSDYQCIVTVTQTPKQDYTTAVIALSGTSSTVDIGAMDYSFGKGYKTSTPSGNNVKSVSTAKDSFTFRSSRNKSEESSRFVGVEENADIGAGFADVAETIVFRNIKHGFETVSPSGVTMVTRPYIWMGTAGIALLAVALLPGYLKKRRRRDGFDNEDTGQRLGGKARAAPANRCGPPGGLDPPEGGHDPPEAVLLTGPRARGDETLFSGAPPEILPRRALIQSLRPQAACRTHAAAGHEAKVCVPGMIPARQQMRLLTETILARARGDPQHIPKLPFGPTRHLAVVWKGG